MINSLKPNSAIIGKLVFAYKSDAKTNVYFEDSEELDSFVIRLSQICGKQISIYSPIVDGKLPDGSRLQTTLAKTVTKGSTFTIRKFYENPLTPIDLINFKSMSVEIAAYFLAGIAGGILSTGIIREKLFSQEFLLVFRDSLILLGLAVLAVILGGFIEVFV